VARDEVNGKPIHQWRGYTTNDEGVRFWGQIAESKRIHAQIGDEKVRLAFPLEKLGEKGTSAR
jgi:hypothetical protein